MIEYFESFFLCYILQIREQYSQDDNFVEVEVLSFKWVNLWEQIDCNVVPLLSVRGVIQL